MRVLDDSNIAKILRKDVRKVLIDAAHVKTQRERRYAVNEAMRYAHLHQPEMFQLDQILLTKDNCLNQSNAVKRELYDDGEE